jgi:dTDP-4-dehydrorhamnose reductase
MRVLIIGAYGQVGQELVRSLKPLIGLQNIVCSDVRPHHLSSRSNTMNIWMLWMEKD